MTLPQLATTRSCTGRCREVKSLTDFPRDATKAHGRGNRCTACDREYKWVRRAEFGPIARGRGRPPLGSTVTATPVKPAVKPPKAVKGAKAVKPTVVPAKPTDFPCRCGAHAWELFPIIYLPHECGHPYARRICPDCFDGMNGDLWLEALFRAMFGKRQDEWKNSARSSAHICFRDARRGSRYCHGAEDDGTRRSRYHGPI